MFRSEGETFFTRDDSDVAIQNLITPLSLSCLEAFVINKSGEYCNSNCQAVTRLAINLLNCAIIPFPFSFALWTCLHISVAGHKY